MAYELGTSSGYTDLLERLKNFISNPSRIIGDDPNMDELVAIDSDLQTGESSQAWTIDKWDDNRDSSGDGEIEMIAHGPGSSGTDEIYVGIDTYSSVGDDYYNWRIMGMTGYASGADLQYQPGITQGRLPRLLMWQQPIKYWFVANGRRFVVVAKVSTVYECAYGGFALPYGLPTQFPYPLVAGGSACPSTTASYNRYSSTQNDHRGFPNPYGSSTTPGSIAVGTFDTTSYESTLKVLSGVSWIELKSKVGSGYYTTNVCWPYSSHNNASYQDNVFSVYMRENIDGSYPVFPVVICLGSPSKHILGELQGCFAVPGYGGIAAEDTFTIDGDTYIAFPIIYNADRSDWWALKKE